MIFTKTTETKKVLNLGDKEAERGPPEQANDEEQETSYRSILSQKLTYDFSIGGKTMIALNTIFRKVQCTILMTTS